MGAAPLPPDEQERLATLRRLELLDTAPEREFDDVVRLACELAQVPMALVSLVDEDRQWFKARIGLEREETPRDVSFCAHAILSDDLFVVHDARLDSRFSSNPYVTDDPAIRFYAGAPLRAPDGRRIGTLCILDQVPRVVPTSLRDALEALRRHVETILALRLRNLQLAAFNAELERLRTEKDLLIQFVAHDMKNSLSSIMLNAEALTTVDRLEEVAEIGTDVLDAAKGLDRLVFDMLDVSRRERGAELRVSLAPVKIDDLLEHAVASARRRALVRRISVTAKWSGSDVVLADRNLLLRVVENLLDNALRYAPNGGSVTLRTTRDGNRLTLSISDNGPGIPSESRERIFSLYEQNESSDPRSRGIGLAFCRMAVEAQGGRISAEQNDGGGTSFCVNLRG